MKGLLGIAILLTLMSIGMAGATERDTTVTANIQSVYTDTGFDATVPFGTLQIGDNYAPVQTATITTNGDWSLNVKEDIAGTHEADGKMDTTRVSDGAVKKLANAMQYSINNGVNWGTLTGILPDPAIAGNGPGAFTFPIKYYQLVTSGDYAGSYSISVSWYITFVF